MKFVILFIGLQWAIACVESQAYGSRASYNSRYPSRSRVPQYVRSRYDNRRAAYNANRYSSSYSDRGEGRILHHLSNHPHHPHSLHYNRRGGNHGSNDPCRRYRNAGQGRFFDFNSLTNGLNGCDQHDSSADSYYDRYRPSYDSYYDRPQRPRPYRPNYNAVGLSNFLQLFSPGGALYSGGGGGGGGGSNLNDPGRPPISPANPDDIYDPVYDDKPVTERIPNDNIPQRPPVQAGDIVGGITNSVTGVIQTIAGSQQRPESFIQRLNRAFNPYVVYL